MRNWGYFRYQIFHTAVYKSKIKKRFSRHKTKYFLFYVPVFNTFIFIFVTGQRWTKVLHRSHLSLIVASSGSKKVSVCNEGGVAERLVAVFRIKCNCIDVCVWVCVCVYIYIYMGVVVEQLLRHCTANRKVAGLISIGVIEIFHWHNPSGHTMALGSTQPLTEMSTRNISWWVKAASA